MSSTRPSQSSREWANQELAPSLGEKQAEKAIVIAILAVYFILQSWLAGTFNINWDEFYFLSHIYSFRNGTLTQSFQTFYVHLFIWLPTIPLTEPDQIVLGRFVMLVSQASSLVSIYIIGRQLLPGHHAAFAVIAYCASGFVIGQGMTFRADPIAAALMMGALAVLFAAPKRLHWALLAGALAALGLLVTIKSVFYLPAFAAAMLHRYAKEERLSSIFGHFALAAVFLGVFYWLGFYYHGSAISGPAAVANVQAAASGALEKTIGSDGLFPRWRFMLRWVFVGFPSAVLLAGGLFLAFRKLARREIITGLTFVLLALPLVSLALYRNAFPYFFPFILAPASVLIGLVSASLPKNVYRLAFLVILAATMVAQFVNNSERSQTIQRQVIAAVHSMFPEPVPYIDRNGMVPSFPKAGFFMSTWGMESAAATGKPVLAKVISDAQPRFVITNGPALTKALEPEFPFLGIRLLPFDEAALRNAYIHHWGPIWIAGTSVEIADRTQPIEISIPGPHTIECAGDPVTINGTRYNCGSAVELGQGTQFIEAARGRRVTLRWGDHISVPSTEAPSGLIYYGF